MSALEEDEQIIQHLEELDSIFSTVKINLRLMKAKIAGIAAVNKQLVSNLRPWSNFFSHGPSGQLSPLSELHLHSLQTARVADSPVVMKPCVPNNPFTDMNSSDLLAKSLLKNFKGSGASESSNTIVLNKSQFVGYDTDAVEDSDTADRALREFSLSEIPAIFHQEEALQALYEFIAERRSVTIDEVCRRFAEVPPEKLEIFASLLTRKKFIRQTSSSLTVDNK
ncbi:hypothetical protein PAPHI01_0739 [Pancytospora philotis]|nr:hypothetical protein PAPHI01_0739 [Pancytospora philotis]